MGYYAGDFYAGARGDPGLGSFFRSALSSVAGFIPGIGGGLSKVIAGGGGGAAATAGRIIKAGKGVIMKHPVMSGAGAAGILLAGGAEAGRMSRGGRQCKHINPRTGKCHRRMNVCNPRALRRSIRRTHGFSKLAMRTIHLVHPKRKPKFGGVRKKKAHK